MERKENSFAHLSAQGDILERLGWSDDPPNSLQPHLG